MYIIEILIREAAKKLSGQQFFGYFFCIFFRALKKYFFLSGLALTPPPLSGRATKKDVFLQLPLVLNYNFDQ